MIWWQLIFRSLLLPEFQIVDRPMLIGIMLRGLREEDSRYPVSKYQCQLLQRSDRLPQTEKSSTLENVLETLRIFKQESLRSQQFLVPSDFVRSTQLCPDIVIEISKYLSLVDAVNAFTLSILPLLEEAHAKIHLVNPSNLLLKIVGEHCDPRQIVSLRITDNFRISQHDRRIFRSFNQLTHVILLSQRGTHVIDHLRRCLPNVPRLSIWFDNKCDLNRFSLLRDLSSPPITHFQIRCPDNCSVNFRNKCQQKH
jgi:hypothetical protein